MTTTIPSRLSDGALVAEVPRLAGCEREASASLVAHLAERYGRRLHERAGYASLFTYCTDALRLSEHEAYDRMRAAKVARRYAAALGLLASGRVNLTTVRLLAPHLTRKNHEELLAAACGKRTRELQELLAARFPQPDVASTIRKLPAPRSEPMSEATSGVTSSTSPSAERAMGAAVTSSGSGGPSPIPAPPPPLVEPLSPDRYRVSFTASRETSEMLEMAQDLLRHTIPSGDRAQIVGRALQALVEDLVRRKFAVARRPRASQGQADESRNIPAEVRRAVFIRDRGRCRFIGTHGRRCGERAFVQFHHLVPYAAGGRPTVENIALRYRAYNAYEAEIFYGPIRDCRSAVEDGGADVVRDRRADVVREGTARVTDDAFSFWNDHSGHGVPRASVP
ncbi:MAG: hypothetical protein DMF78_01700 [Acidobacteria bacterium]|nr:MAG: hypothetical protein DMF78_01700 [Acidobacteriota bacterium]